ncbi:MAG TPA: hypothetical protein VKW77_04570, partial [Acidimicrobiales bacterium]|nr:hypothetical protein [Acidimicrobiales bacterium]
RGWHLVTFGGLRLAVPPSWAVHRTVFAGPLPCQARAPSALPGLLSAPPSVTLDAGTLAPAVACPNQPAPSAPGVGPQVTAQPAASQPVSGPTDGLLIDPGPVGPLNPSASYSPCLSIHGLRACVDEDYPYGELVLRVERPHGRSVAVVVGLGGNGRTARAVLFSLRPA